MRKLSMLTGFAVGYYAGAQAGHERYEQINEWLRKLTRWEPVQATADAARTLAEEGAERAAEVADRATGDGRRTRTASSRFPSSVPASPSAAAVGE